MRLSIGCLGTALLVAACTATPSAPGVIVSDSGIVTTPSGAGVAGMLVGPVRLEVGTVGRRTCYWLRDPNGLRHGVIWPFGTVAADGGVRVPGLGETLRPGTAFWSGGGLGADSGSPELGACDAPPDFWLGGQFSLTNPMPTT